MRKKIRTKYRPEFPNEFIFDFKDPVTLNGFIMDGGKIVPSRISKVSTSQQRKVARAVRVARSLALLPVGTYAYDQHRFADQVSAKPFEF